MHTDKAYTGKLALEIIALHRFFEEWFGGACERSEQVFAERLLCRMHREFTIVLPGGVMLKGDHFWPELKDMYGNNPHFHISLRNIHERENVSDHVHLVTYEEWQRNAKNSEPPNNGRISSAIFMDDAEAPNGIKWFHVHETWFPSAVMSAESYTWEPD